MARSMSVNEMLKQDITKIDCNLVPPGFCGDTCSLRVMQDSLSKVIDELGAQSAAAQGLNKVITTAKKLRDSPTHIVYLLKDPHARQGRGEALGLLKVGFKHLYLFDEQTRMHVVEPLCVLDLFVQYDCQRRGLGKRLFDHMLQDTGASLQRLAVDGPSPAMEQFLRKNYGVERLLRQTNNFAVPVDFFRQPDTPRSGRSTPEPSRCVGRFAAPRPSDSIASVIHGQGEGAPPAPHHPRSESGATPLEPGGAGLGGRARPTSLLVAPPTAPPGVDPGVTPGASSDSRRSSQLTERGYFDVKFHHDKLW